MLTLKNIAVIIAILLVIGALAYFVSNLLAPPKADYNDYFVEDIGGNDFLVANFTHCKKLSEENIPDGSFKASTGTFNYYGANNITYVDYVGLKDYVVVWKASPDKYGIFDTENKVNQYISDYLVDENAKCFVEYSYDDNEVYGIIVGCNNSRITEYELVYDILGLNKTGFSLSYTDTASSYGYSSYGSQNHYHTVVPDRYTLSRSDPGAYYDHYEYGDNYDIDDYLESQGYD